MNAIPWHDIGGGLVFAGAVLTAVTILRWLIPAVVAYEPTIVYRIPLIDGRVYYGHAKDKDVRLRRHWQFQKGLPDGHPRKWWPLVPAYVRDSRPLIMPDEWVIGSYRSKPLAEQVEQRMIRTAGERGEVTANVIKYKGVIDSEAA